MYHSKIRSNFSGGANYHSKIHDKLVIIHHKSLFQNSLGSKQNIISSEISL